MTFHISSPGRVSSTCLCDTIPARARSHPDAYDWVQTGREGHHRLFDNLLDLGTGDREGGAWIPNVDILEGQETLTVKVELPPTHFVAAQSTISIVPVGAAGSGTTCMVAHMGDKVWQK